MQKSAFILACLVLRGHGQQRHVTSWQPAGTARSASAPMGASAVDPSRALALLLLASGSVAAYTPSGPGAAPLMRSLTLASLPLSLYGGHQLRHGLPMMKVRGRDEIIDSAIRAEQFLEEKDPRTLRDSWKFEREKKLLTLDTADDMEWFFVKPAAEKAYTIMQRWYKASLRSDWAPKSDNAGAPHLFALRKKYVGFIRHSFYLAQLALGKMEYDDCKTMPKNDEGLERYVENWKRTEIYSAISIDYGSAMAFVSKWEDRKYWSIDCIVINPDFMTEGEFAERALLEHIGAEAVKSGIDQVRLPNPVDQYDDDFYERAGYFPMEGDLSFMLKYNPDHAKESA
mmetsp:Transcript_45075/g.82504  ORF Transcript_45075/g.82504 Transcript_45075/m.82504 type:complete len:342 (-) Transcript_45075:8-1033(-)